ncbi:hypothetical protein Tco_0855119 [Tanacetum coccineum]
MNVPITFPPVPARDLSEEALVMEDEIEGYLVKRIHIDKGASVEIMYEHCFNMLHPKIKARLAETQTTVSGFSGERVKPLGKIKLDVCFGAKSNTFHYTWDDEIPNTMGNYDRPFTSTHNPGCRREEKKQAREKKKDPVEEMEPMESPSLTELVLVNPALPISNIAETFDNLRRINRKLNPKKCSFGVEEGKLLGYMVTSEGIRANLAKTKDIAEMKSPRTWGEMQSLAGKLAALNRFLARSAEKSLPFFETLKNITKENKEDYKWTEEAEKAFQELKKTILDLPTLNENADSKKICTRPSVSPIHKLDAVLMTRSKW